MLLSLTVFPDFRSCSLQFPALGFFINAQMNTTTVDAFTEKLDGLASRCSKLKRTSQDGEEGLDLTQIKKTAIAEYIGTLKRKNRYLRAEMQSLQQTIEDFYITGPDQKRRKSGYISSILDVKYIGIVSKLLASARKFFWSWYRWDRSISRGKCKKMDPTSGNCVQKRSPSFSNSRCDTISRRCDSACCKLKCTLLQNPNGFFEAECLQY